jgi:hypothetical protein
VKAAICRNRELLLRQTPPTRGIMLGGDRLSPVWMNTLVQLP